MTMQDRRIYSEAKAVPGPTAEPDFQYVEDQVFHLIELRQDRDTVSRRVAELNESIRYHEEMIKARLSKLDGDTFRTGARNE